MLSASRFSLFIAFALVGICLADEEKQMESSEANKESQLIDSPSIGSNFEENSAELDGDYADVLEKRFSSTALVDNLRQRLQNQRTKRFSSSAMVDNLRQMLANQRSKRFSSGAMVDNLRQMLANQRSKRFSSSAMVDNLRQMLANQRSKRFSSGAMVDNLRQLIRTKGTPSSQRIKRFSSAMLFDNLREALASGQNVQIRVNRDHVKRFDADDEGLYFE